MKKENKISKEKVYISTEYTHSWECPLCLKDNYIERDGDGFENPTCERCGIEFDNFEEE